MKLLSTRLAVFQYVQQLRLGTRYMIRSQFLHLCGYSCGCREEECEDTDPVPRTFNAPTPQEVNYVVDFLWSRPPLRPFQLAPHGAIQFTKVDFR